MRFFMRLKFILVSLLFSFSSHSNVFFENECEDDKDSFFETVVNELSNGGCREIETNVGNFLENIPGNENPQKTKNIFNKAIKAVYDPSLVEACKNLGNQRSNCEFFVKNHKSSIIAQMHIETLFRSNSASGNNFFNMKDNSYNKTRNPNPAFRSLASGTVTQADDGVNTNQNVTFANALNGLKGYLFFMFTARNDDKGFNYGSCFNQETKTNPYILFGCFGVNGYATSALQPEIVDHVSDAPVWGRVNKEYLRIRKSDYNPKTYPVSRKVGDGKSFIDVLWTGNVKNEYGFKVQKYSTKYKNLQIDAYANCLSNPGAKSNPSNVAQTQTQKQNNATKPKTTSNSGNKDLGNLLNKKASYGGN